MLIETICIQNGEVLNLSWHQARLDKSQRALFNDHTPIDLNRVIHPPSGSGTLRCRVLYGPELYEITYKPYRPRTVRTLKLVEADIAYAHKFSDRSALDTLFATREEADDILIVRDGEITDTSIANVAFCKNGRWYTPRTPLLRGTTRERLVHTGFLTPRKITVDELAGFDTFALMNAMIGFVPVKDGKIV